MAEKLSALQTYDIIAERAKGGSRENYGEHVAVFSISPVALIIGFIPQRQQRLVEAWAELHEEELLADWRLLEQGRKPSPITPLQ